MVFLSIVHVSHPVFNLFQVENIEPSFPDCEEYSKTSIYEDFGTPQNTMILKVFFNSKTK